MPYSTTTLEALRVIARTIVAQINAGANQRRNAEDTGGPIMKGIMEAYDLGRAEQKVESDDALGEAVRGLDN